MSRLAHSNEHGLLSLDRLNLPRSRCIQFPEFGHRLAVDGFECLDLLQNRPVPSLCAYRWDGESELNDEKFVTVDARD